VRFLQLSAKIIGWINFIEGCLADVTGSWWPLLTKCCYSDWELSVFCCRRYCMYMFTNVYRKIRQ